MAFSYDGGGRITNFNGKDYHYSSGPVHGVNSIGVRSFIYDNNGNQIQSDDRTLEYSAFNKTKRMYRNTTSVEFEYDNNNNRYKRTDVGLDENETTYYVGNVEFITKDNGEVINKRYIGDTVISHYLNTQIKEIKYLHKDHLGSIQSVTDQSYNSLTTSHLSYDAYGRRRDAGNNTTVLDQNPIADVTKRGFTGQEHVDQLGIINYNARLYDPELGIMLQADTIIPDGPVTQSMNRYSYVFNNPLSYTDPTGHSPDWFANRAMPSSDFIEETTVAVQRDRSGRRIFNDSAQKSGSGATVEGINDATVGSPGGYQGNGLGGNDEFTGIDNPGGIQSPFNQPQIRNDIIRRNETSGSANSSNSIAPLTATEEAGFIETLKTESDNTFRQLGVKMNLALDAGDLELGGQFMQARQVLSGNVVFDLQNTGPNNAIMNVKATFNKNGNLINSTLTIFNGAYAAFLTGNNPPPPYFLGIPSGARGLRLLFAHESGHGIISRTLDQKFRSLSNTRRERLADDWALKVWEQ